MKWQVPEEVAALLDLALKTPLLARGSAAALAPEGAPFDRRVIERFLPHRNAALLLDAVEALDLARGLVQARCQLEQARALLAGHFPDAPVWPGVQQIEAIGQAGLLLERRRSELRGQVRLVSVIAARFLAPVLPPEPVEVQAQLIDDGLFFVVVGQCIQRGSIRSVAALRLINEEDGYAT